MRRVAVTGIGCICALGSDPGTFWAAAASGRSGIDRITRFDAGTFDVRLAAEVRDCATFEDDPKIAFALHAAAQALADAGIARLPARSLVHAGTSLEYFDPRRIVAGGSVDFRSAVDRCFGPDARRFQVPLDTAAGCIQAAFGPARQSLTNVGACAASTQAIGHAFRRVRDGSFDLALCGGFDSMVNAFGVGGFQLLGALTTDNGRGPRACRPFDASRSGTVLGEGAAFLVLEPLERAVVEGRAVRAEVLGYGASLDAYKPSAPDPDGAGARTAMMAALADAGLRPEDVDAISAHATGTALNDRVEASAIRTVLASTWERTPVVATKSLIGHLIGAAGAVEVVACLQGFRENRLHPNGSLEKVGEGCVLDHVVGEARPFEGRVILKNSFGFGGQNAALVLGRGSS